MSGTISVITPGGASAPPKALQTYPAACAVTATEATLKAARYRGWERRTRTVHCSSTPVDAVTMATCGPIVQSATRSAAHAIDMVDTFRPSGSRSLKIDSSADDASSASARIGLG